MSAISIEDRIALLFTTVLDELTLGMDDEEEEKEATDRNYWETIRGTKETVALADNILNTIHKFAPEFSLKYNKFYIGLAKNGSPYNFVEFKPRKKYIILHIKLKQSDDIQKILDETEIDIMDYDKRWGEYRLRLTDKEINKYDETLSDLMKMAYENFGG